MERIHLIGIGGTGLSAIALLLLEMGYAVTGSDRQESPFTHDLRAAGVTIGIGHSPENIVGVDKVVRSSAIPDDNPEVVAARAAGIPVLKRADFLGELMTGRTGIAVAGTHGKTTTTAMIAWILYSLKLDPSFIIGGVMNNLGINARAGVGDVFLIEADEYDRMFLGLKPQVEVITNVEHDHPDFYPTPADFHQAFMEFVQLLPEDGKLVACAEDPGARLLIEEATRMDRYVASYGLRPMTRDEKITMDVYANMFFANGKGGYTFSASVFGNQTTVELQVPGKHNISNGLAALAATAFVGVPANEAAQALGGFEGTGRRFEVRGESNGVTVVDDYAHHPTEIRATLSAARSRYPGRQLRVVWQPHTYSRTRTLFDEFAGAFDDADEVIVTEVFAAREPKQDFSASSLVDEMPRSAHFIPDLPGVSNYLISVLQPGDVLLVLSAGDANQISTMVLNALSKRNL